MARKLIKNRKRTFNGVVYKESQGNLSKTKAREIVDVWHMKGRKARVLPSAWPTINRWSVFLASK